MLSYSIKHRTDQVFIARNYRQTNLRTVAENIADNGQIHTEYIYRLYCSSVKAVCGILFIEFHRALLYTGYVMFFEAFPRFLVPLFPAKGAALLPVPYPAEGDSFRFEGPPRASVLRLVMTPRPADNHQVKIGTGHGGENVRTSLRLVWESVGGARCTCD